MNSIVPPASPSADSQPSSSTTVEANVQLIVLYDFFYVFGLISLTAVFATAWFSPHIKRASTWFLFIFSWMFTCVINLLLLGKQTGPLPGWSLCIGQAMLIYALPVFSSFCTLSFILHMYLSVLSAIRGRMGLLTNFIKFSLHLSPWIFFLAISFMVLAMGFVDPAGVERDPSGMYCHLKNTLPSKVDAVLVMLAMAGIITLEVLIFLHLRRTWKERDRVRSLGAQANISIDALVRVAIFSFLPMLALGISCLNFLPAHVNPVKQYSKTNIVVAMLPTAAGLIFGTQRDILRVWMCRAGNTQIMLTSA